MKTWDHGNIDIMKYRSHGNTQIGKDLQDTGAQPLGIPPELGKALLHGELTTGSDADSQTAGKIPG